jgi:hypothetical protein
MLNIQISKFKFSSCFPFMGSFLIYMKYIYLVLLEQKLGFLCLKNINTKLISSFFVRL